MCHSVGINPISYDHRTIASPLANNLAQFTSYIGTNKQLEVPLTKWLPYMLVLHF